MCFLRSFKEQCGQEHSETRDGKGYNEVSSRNFVLNVQCKPVAKNELREASANARTDHHMEGLYQTYDISVSHQTPMVYLKERVY